MYISIKSSLKLYLVISDALNFVFLKLILQTISPLLLLYMILSKYIIKQNTHFKSGQKNNYSVSDGGDEGDRTPYLLNAIQALSQVSYTPILRDTE